MSQEMFIKIAYLLYIVNIQVICIFISKSELITSHVMCVQIAYQLHSVYDVVICIFIS